jgi:hypothetical protein
MRLKNDKKSLSYNIKERKKFAKRKKIFIISSERRNKGKRP